MLGVLALGRNAFHRPTAILSERVSPVWIVSIIGVNELQHFANDIGSGHPVEAFVMVSVMYLVVIVPLSRVITYLERVRRIPGLGTPTPTTAERMFGVRRRSGAPAAQVGTLTRLRLAWKGRDRLRDPA